MRRVLISVSLIGVLALGVAAGGGVAPAATGGSVSLKIESTGPGTAKYSGKVSSSKSKCRKGRKIEVFHDSDPPFKIGETDTESDGSYSLDGVSPPSGDRVFVVVKPKGRGSKRCKELNESKKVP